MAIILCFVISARAQARYYDPASGRFLSPDTIVQDPNDPQSLNRYAYVRNNPVIFTDPSGNKWKLGNVWDKIGELVKSVLLQPPHQPRSGAEDNRPASPGGSGSPGKPGRSNSDLRSIIAVQQTPILFSGPTTVLTWVVVDSLSDRLLSSGDYEKYASKIYGHPASEKEKRALAAALSLGASYAYHRIATYPAYSGRGRGWSEKNPLDPPKQSFNNIGYAHRDPPHHILDEGNGFSRFANKVFGVNAVSGVHDPFQIELEQKWGENARAMFNVPGMPVAAGIVYPALLWQPIWLFRDEIQSR